jgi:hypothetical protein
MSIKYGMQPAFMIASKTTVHEYSGTPIFDPFGIFNAFKIA